MALVADGAEVTLEIRDNGKGLPEKQSARPDAFGLRGMTERARVHGGWVEISSQPGKGTTVMAAVPMAAGSEGAAPA